MQRIDQKKIPPNGWPLYHVFTLYNYNASYCDLCLHKTMTQEHQPLRNPSATDSSESKLREKFLCKPNSWWKLVSLNSLYMSVLLSWWPGSFSLSLVTKPFFGVVGLAVSVGASNAVASGDLGWWPGNFSINLLMKPSFLAPCLGAGKETRTTLKIRNRIIKKAKLVQKNFELAIQYFTHPSTTPS